jgi:hypothetical protein
MSLKYIRLTRLCFAELQRSQKKFSFCPNYKYNQLNMSRVVAAMKKTQLPVGVGWSLGGLIGLIFWVTTAVLMDKNGAIVGFILYLVSFIIIGSVFESRTKPPPQHYHQRFQKLVLMGIILLSIGMIGFLLMYLCS